MSDRLTIADALADGKRAFSWRRQVFRTLLLIVFAITAKLYTIPAVDHTIRVTMALVLIPLLIGGYFEWATEEKRVDEFQREVMRDANGTTFRLMFHVLWFLFLLDLGFGLPVSTNMPWGLSPISIDWRLSGTE